MNNSIRTVLGGVVLALMVLGLAVIIPATPGMLWSNVGAMLVSILMMVLATLFVLNEGQKGPQVFVFPSLAWQFLGYHVLLAVVTIVLDLLVVWSTPWAVVLVGHSIVLGILTLLVLGTSVGKDEIEQTQDLVRVKVSNWKGLVAEVAVVRGRVPAGNPEAQKALKALDALHEVFRYSDPMTHPSLETQEADLRSAILELSPTVEGSQWEEVISRCQRLQERLQERNVRVKGLK